MKNLFLKNKKIREVPANWICSVAVMLGHTIINFIYLYCKITGSKSADTFFFCMILGTSLVWFSFASIFYLKRDKGALNILSLLFCVLPWLIIFFLL